jgi:spermidine/putrescine transport system substrate-binding protein
LIKILALILGACFVGCGRPKQQLNLFIWSEYIDPAVVADFEKQFECKVVIDLHETAESMITKLETGGASTYDIVIPSSRTLPMMVQRGLLAPLRRENIPNLTNIVSQFVDPPYDPKNRYGAPYLWGTSGLFIRRAPGQTVDETWGLIFDPRKQPGPFLLIDSPRECIGAALQYKGHSLNSTNMAELLEARDLIVEAKKRSLGFEGGIGCKNRVLAKGATVAITWTEVRGVKEDPETYYFVPREGSGIWVDHLCIPAQAPHRDLAEKFINYILDPKVGARVAEVLGAATANRAAMELLSPGDRDNPSIYPPPEVLRRLEFANDLGEQNRLYDELWTQIKSR